MRKPLAISLVLSSALGGSAVVAAPQGAATGTQCGGTLETGCFIDEVMVVKGEEMGADGPLVTCVGSDCILGKEMGEFLKPSAVDRAVAKAVSTAVAKGAAGPWDEVVIFTADFGQLKDVKTHGPLFYRAKNMAGEFLNEVQGIGLPVVPRGDGKFIGTILAGTSKNTSGTADSAFGKVFGAGANGNFNKSCDESTNSLCFKDIYTYFDALAQATAAIYGPYLPGKITYGPLAKSSLVAPPDPNAMPTDPNYGLPTSINGGMATGTWNALLNTGGSLLGGNTWRDKGNGTWEVARPTAFQGVSAPFENSQVLRFMPLDLYILGFAPASEVPNMGSFRDASAATIYAPANTSSFSATVGPGMGVKISGVSLRTSPATLTSDLNVCKMGMSPPANCLLTGKDRVPASDSGAPQAIKQLWVVVTKPGADAGAQKTEVQNVAKARRSFQQYFYNLASYRGRIITTADGEDDSGYFEFGDKDDDVKEFDVRGSWVGKGIEGMQEIPNTGGRAITVARLNGTGLAWKGGSRPMRIVGSSEIPAANNVATVRLRIPASGEELHGKLSFNCGGSNVDFNVPGGDGKLLADGKFHNYSVALTDEGFNKSGNVCNGFEFTVDKEIDGLEVDFIKIGNTGSGNLKDEDKDCDGKSDKADGWLALEDNCPKHYNPGQEDGNGDGIGDACEDYDGDNVVNLCDNCPTVTNSSQRNANGNNLGDACDGSQAETCFFSGATVAGTGAAPSSASIWAGLAVFGLMVTGAVRRRLRRK